MNRRPSCLIALLLVGSSLFAQTKQDVIAAFQDGDSPRARELYGEFLKTGEIDATSLDECSVVFDSASEELTFLIPFMSQSSVVGVRVGVLRELLGDLPGASQAYAQAARDMGYDEGGADLLIRAAFLAVETGETALAEAMVRPLTLAESDDVLLVVLQGQIALVEGDHDSAAIAVNRVLNRTDSGVAALAWAFDTAGVLELSEARDAASERLDRFPGGQWIKDQPRFPSVLRYLGLTAPLLPPKTESREPTEGIDVLVGSFANPDNAAALVERLESKGFDPAIRDIELHGDRYQRVVVVAPAGEVQDLLTSLKEAGFEATPLY